MITRQFIFTGYFSFEWRPCEVNYTIAKKKRIPRKLDSEGIKAMYWC
jgi:hypothetical protein